MSERMRWRQLWHVHCRVLSRTTLLAYRSKIKSILLWIDLASRREVFVVVRSNSRFVWTFVQEHVRKMFWRYIKRNRVVNLHKIQFSYRFSSFFLNNILLRPNPRGMCGEMRSHSFLRPQMSNSMRTAVSSVFGAVWEFVRSFEMYAQVLAIVYAVQREMSMAMWAPKMHPTVLRAMRSRAVWDAVLETFKMWPRVRGILRRAVSSTMSRVQFSRAYQDIFRLWGGSKCSFCASRGLQSCFWI